jgi:hypothetical protein
VNLVKDVLGVTFVTANKLVEELEELELLDEVTGGKRNRIFRYTPYLALFEGEEGAEDQAPVETTEAEA